MQCWITENVRKRRNGEMIAWDSRQFWQNGVVPLEKLFDLMVMHSFIAKMIVAG